MSAPFPTPKTASKANNEIRKMKQPATRVGLRDRHALDDMVSEVLGVTAGEREAVYEAVVSLVRARLEKAKSV